MRVVRIFVVDLVAKSCTCYNYTTHVSNSDAEDAAEEAEVFFIQEYNAAIFSHTSNGSAPNGYVVTATDKVEKQLRKDEEVEGLNEWWLLKLTPSEEDIMNELEIEPDAWSVKGEDALPIWCKRDRIKVAVDAISIECFPFRDKE